MCVCVLCIHACICTHITYAVVPLGQRSFKWLSDCLLDVSAGNGTWVLCKSSRLSYWLSHNLPSPVILCFWSDVLLDLLCCRGALWGLCWELLCRSKLSPFLSPGPLTAGSTPFLCKASVSAQLLLSRDHTLLSPHWVSTLFQGEPSMFSLITAL